MGQAADVTSLVYHAGALGDFITTLPAIAVWRRRAGRGRVVLLGRPAHAALAVGLVDEAWDAGDARFAPLYSGRSTPEVRSLLAAVGTALVFAPEGAGIVPGLENAGVQDIVRGAPFPRGRLHIVDHHLSLFPDLEFAPEERVPRVVVDEQSAPPVAVEPRPIVIHPGSGSSSKNWPIDRFISVGAVLAGHGPIAWVVGPAEEESGIAAAIAALFPRASTWRAFPLPDLARSFAGARLLVGNDSGVAHLAAAVGCPVVALFGASDPVVWAPRGSSVTVVGDGTCGMEAIGEDAVMRAALATLAARIPREGFPPG